MNEQPTPDSAERVVLDEPAQPPPLPPGRATRPRGASPFNQAVEKAFRVPSAFYARYPGLLTVGVLGFLAALVMSDLGQAHDWYGGEALPQRALAEEVIKGDFPPGGPYAGLPTHLPPLYGTALGLVSRFTGVDPFRLVGLASVLGAVMLPLIAYVTGKVLFGDWRPAAAGAAFVTFGAGFSDLHLGDSSLFTSGHLFAPMVPLDIGLLLIPLAAALFVRAAEEDAVRFGSYIGVIAAVLVVTHLQSVLYLFAVIVALGSAWIAMRPREWKKVLAMALTILLAGVVLSAWWWLPQVWVGAREGGILMQTVSSADEVTLGIGDWLSEFGWMLVLALVGAAFAVSTSLRTKRLAPMLAVGWFGILFLGAAFFAGVLPEELALRADRLALLATFPMGLLAGLAVTEWRHWFRTAPGVYAFGAAVVFAVFAAMPTLSAQRDLALAQTEPVYAAWEWTWDERLGFADWFRDPENGVGTDTFVADDPEAAIAWFFAGMKPLAWSAPPFYSMAYNVGETTGLSQTLRVRAQAEALSGTWDALLRATNSVQDDAEIELKYAVLSQVDGTVALSVATAQQLAATSEDRGTAVQLEQTEDGLSYLAMDEDGQVEYIVNSSADQTAQFVARIRSSEPGKDLLTITTDDGDTPVDVFEDEAGFWIEVPLELRLVEGENSVQITANVPLDVAAIYGYTETLDDIPPGFRVRFDDGATAIIEIPRL